MSVDAVVRGSGKPAGQVASSQAEAESQRKEEEAFLRWLGGPFVSFGRIVLALILTIWAALPLASTLATRLGEAAFTSLVSVIPLSETVIVTNPGAAEEATPRTISMQGGQSTAQGREKRREITSAASRVSAYGIQIAGLLVALAGTLWGIVALSRVE